jgi:hypothetical protein
MRTVENDYDYVTSKAREHTFWDVYRTGLYTLIDRLSMVATLLSERLDLLEQII